MREVVWTNVFRNVNLKKSSGFQRKVNMFSLLCPECMHTFTEVWASPQLTYQPQQWSRFLFCVQKIPLENFSALIFDFFRTPQPSHNFCRKSSVMFSFLAIKFVPCNMIWLKLFMNWPSYIFFRGVRGGRYERKHFFLHLYTVPQILKLKYQVISLGNSLSSMLNFSNALQVRVAR